MAQPNKITKRLTTISLYGMSRLLAVASVLLISLVIVTFHSTELWGEYAEILIWSNVVLLFLGFGSHDYLLRSFSRSPSTIDQQWTVNFTTRSLLFIPAAVVVFLAPVFQGYEWLILGLILFQFINTAFRVLLLYHRDFAFNIKVELLYNVAVITALWVMMDTLDLGLLILIISLGQLLKALCYGVFYLKGFKNVKWGIAWNDLARSTPFFIPLAVGTVRMKVDIYYGTYFFSVNDLSKYQIFLSFLMLAQMAGPFILNPYLKNFYRSGTMVNKLQKLFFWYGWPFAILMSVAMFVALTYVYQLDFTMLQYLLAFVFIAPLMFHTTLVSEYYKENKQKQIAVFSSVLVVLQIVLGYFLISASGIDGALILKVLGQWAIVIVLWWWLRRKNRRTIPVEV
ncbi:hypothetical protein POV27_17035 [Aureisphaera galaxeae]|uniref:lipopolysaccharide biosynthesis protein n=1 Tax=Aureisphaera galaxeae TaxID=1538023 RepID=UPI00234FEB59|nr:hypothetical protein [Aureisphaera galaxeae]MDC8005762.1 hypothetical protein [Aureisphaera galaxeae]